MSRFGKHQEKQQPDRADAFSRPVMVVPPLTDKRKSQDEARKKAMDEAQTKALAWDQSQAEQGEAYGQLRMGERYRDGDGVAKDLVLAQSWLSKSAYQGNSHAIKALSELLKR
jgi:TPR repeat protein